jgi:mono/diheme cytochrome c family protein
MRAYVATFALSAVLVVVSQNLAQNPADASKPKQKESVYAEIAKAPEKARAKRNPLETDPQAVAAGRILFKQHCSECHGDSAEGGKKGPNLRAEEIQSAAPGAIFWILTNGVVRRGMPVWSKLPEPQRWQLVAYLKSLGVQPSLPPSNPTRSTISPSAAAIPCDRTPPAAPPSPGSPAAIPYRPTPSPRTTAQS